MCGFGFVQKRIGILILPSPLACLTSLSSRLIIKSPAIAIDYHTLSFIMLLSTIARTSTTATSRILSKRCLSSSSKTWNVYLSGEIHSDWREVIANGIKNKDLPVTLTSPNTSHEDSDDCGKIIYCIISYISFYEKN